jgi:hypothetical protein
MLTFKSNTWTLINFIKKSSNIYDIKSLYYKLHVMAELNFLTLIYIIIDEKNIKGWASGSAPFAWTMAGAATLLDIPYMAGGMLPH